MKLRLEIDPYKLEQEWQSHPETYGYWAEMAVEAQDVHDRAKSEVDLVAAECSRAIRKNPKNFGIDKVTDTQVAQTVLLQTEYKQALGRLHAAKRELNLAKAALDALEHRKRALSLLVELWIREYYAEASGKKAQSNFGGSADDYQKKADIRNQGRLRKRDRDREVDTT